MSVVCSVGNMRPVFTIGIAGDKMFRLWVRLVEDNHLIKDMVVCDESNDTRTHKGT